MDRIRQTVLVALATAIFLPTSSEATVLLSNLAEPTRDATDISLEQWAAQAFITDGTSHDLSWIDVLLGNLSESPTILAELHADDGSSSVGSLLTTFVIPSIPATDPELRRLIPVSAIALSPNTTYWVVFGALGQGSFGWSYAEGNASTGPGSFGSYGYSLDAGATWENFGVDNPYKMEIEVSGTSVVPEPASVLLLFTGFCAALASGSRRRSA